MKKSSALITGIDFVYLDKNGVLKKMPRRKKKNKAFKAGAKDET